MLISNDAFEALYEFTRAHEAWELDELVSASLAALLSVLLALTITTARKNRELNRAIAEARATELKAEQASQAKTRFINSMSHELRTPLNAVLGFSDLLLRSRHPTLSDEQREHANHVRQAGQRLLSIVEDVLTMADIDALAASVDLVEVDVTRVLRQCAAEHEAKARHATVSIAVDAPPACIGRSDPTYLRLIVSKLIANAIDYNRSGGSVTIAAAPSHEAVEVRVSDTGCGVPSDRISGIFDAFDRGGREDLTVSGTGVGLTICKRLAEAMLGGLSVRSEEGVGTVFSLRIRRTG